jgi:hypothetical protein
MQYEVENSAGFSLTTDLAIGFFFFFGSAGDETQGELQASRQVLVLCH